jgi:hypothetical protein
MATAFLAVVLLAGHAAAQAGAVTIAEGTYEGATTNGTPVSFVVFESTEVDKWFAEGPPAPVPGTLQNGSPCMTDKAGFYTDPAPIVNAHFDFPLRPNGPPDGDEGNSNVSGAFAGTFTELGKAHGTYQVQERGQFDGDCTSVLMSWTAKLTDPTDDGLCEQAKAKLKKAKKRLHRADTEAAKKTAKKRVKRARNKKQILC